MHVKTIVLTPDDIQKIAQREAAQFSKFLPAIKEAIEASPFMTKSSEGTVSELAMAYQDAINTNESLLLDDKFLYGINITDQEGRRIDPFLVGIESGGLARKPNLG